MMGTNTEGTVNLKEWAITRMDYIPHISKTNNGNIQDFRTKLMSARLGTYWRYLVRHARSSEQVQHIRNNLKIQEFEAAKIKNKIGILSASTATMSETVASDLTFSAENDSVLTYGSNSSNISERSFLLKEYAETKRLLKKSNGLTRNAQIDVKSRLEQCEEFKDQLQHRKINSEEKREKIKFLSLLILHAKQSIEAMKQDVQHLNFWLRTRFDGSDSNYLSKNDTSKECTNQLITVLCNKLKCLLKESIMEGASSTANGRKEKSNLDEVKQLAELLLLQCGENNSEIAYNIADVHAGILTKVRNVTWQIRNTLSSPTICHDKQLRPNSRLETLLSNWREKYVLLNAESKKLAAELVMLQDITVVQVRKTKNAVVQVCESTCNSGMESNCGFENQKIMQKYFMLCEKRARLNVLLQHINRYLELEKAQENMGGHLRGGLLHTKRVTDGDIRSMLSVMRAQEIQILNKKEKIELVIGRNSNLRSKLIWLEAGILQHISSQIKPTIQKILVPTSTKVAIDRNKGQPHTDNLFKDQMLQRLNNFVVSPIHLNMSLNLSGRCFGRSCGRLGESWKKVQESHTATKWYQNCSLALTEVVNTKHMLKHAANFLDAATSLHFDMENYDGVKNALTQRVAGSSKNDSNCGSMEDKIRKSRECTKLVHKLDQVVIQIEAAQIHFRFVT